MNDSEQKISLYKCIETKYDTETTQLPQNYTRTLQKLATISSAAARLDYYPSLRSQLPGRTKKGYNIEKKVEKGSMQHVTGSQIEKGSSRTESALARQMHRDDFNSIIQRSESCTEKTYCTTRRLHI